ncbi:diguanylate cyclase with PAS/PAC sensor [Oleidesulfovibrio alaskensis G20]|uniref:diguanylate cyclase n=1 Tax=Oleidesulfovibrio alaskensis (strain ATCC BAA-1058 / DSM 17464 / G20) TaxID=207559 RepID=Q314H8_OLEA2|nr:diguanylate cyclase [Oleidesulfovibrio alaskensis]ABB37668.1 diguanylate cyclase with PAS/PAC sensor [Oleidesulfovibrio alaskensis G20]
MERFYRELLDTLTDGIYFVTSSGKITYWNKSAERLSGYAASEVVGKSCGDNVLRHVDDCGTPLCLTGCPLAATLRDSKIREARVYMHHKQGYRVPVLVRTFPMADAQGNSIGAVEVFTDDSKNINFKKEMEELRREVLTDPLTEVGNRRYAEIILERMQVSMNDVGSPYAVIFVDIDLFKDVNDTWGHIVGDNVLKMVAKTIESSLRPLDAVCRWGGEEFIICVPGATKDGVMQLMERLRMLVQESWIMHEQHKIAVTASFGAAICSQGESSESVAQRADEQLYLSKNTGRNCVHLDGVRGEQCSRPSCRCA